MHDEAQNALKVWGDKKATGHGDVPEEVYRSLGEDGLKTKTQLINSRYETGEWPKGFIGVTMTAFKRKPEATKCTVSLNAHIAKILARVREELLRGKLRVYLEKISLEFLSASLKCLMICYGMKRMV